MFGITVWLVGDCVQNSQPTKIYYMKFIYLFVCRGCVCQCNATCGRGVRQRQVVCAGLEGGVFKEFPDSSCDQTNKPETSSSCFQRPCSKWFTTSWSQVSLCFHPCVPVCLFLYLPTFKSGTPYCPCNLTLMFLDVLLSSKSYIVHPALVELSVCGSEHQSNQTVLSPHAPSVQ